MERAKKSTYWLILPVLMIAAWVMSMVVAPTQSRYTTVTGWQMTLSQVEERLHCNLLTQDGQKIRLQDMTVGDIRQISLTLTAVGDAENVTVTVESQYLTADMELIGSIYNGETLERILTLSANEGAMQTVTTPTEASMKVTLTWDGGTLQGEFLVLLLPKETSSEDTGDPSGGTTENPGEVTEPSTGENEENIPENDENAEENTGNQKENDEILTAADDADGDTTTGGDTSEGDTSTEDTPADDTPMEDTSTDDTPAENTPTDDTTADDSTIPDEPDSPEVGVWLSGMSNFAVNGALPLVMEVPEGCEEIRLELAVGENPAGAFPAGTRYSTDNGASDTLLYDPYVIGVYPEEGAQSVSVLVDFSTVELDSEQMLTVTASALKGEQIFAVSSLLTQGTLNVPVVALDTDPPVLTADHSIQFVMPVYGDSHTVTVTPLNEEQTEGLPSVNLEDGLLTISSNGGAAKPGTYQAVMAWSWSGLEVARQEFTFYVNYTPYVPKR